MPALELEHSIVRNVLDAFQKERPCRFSQLRKLCGFHERLASGHFTRLRIGTLWKRTTGTFGCVPKIVWKMTKAYEFNWQVPVPEPLLKGCVFDMWEEDKEETNYEPDALFRVDDLGFFIYWKSTGSYGRVLELSHVNDIRRGGLPKDSRFMTELMSRNKYNLDDVSLTICSGTDMVNINYTHVVCPDPETAQLWQSGLRQITNNIKANNVCPSTCLKKHWMKLCFMVDPNGKIPVRRIAQTFASGKTEKMVYQCIADVGLPSGKNDSIEPEDFTVEKFYQIYLNICPRNDIEELFQSITQGKVETINIQQLVTFLNDPVLSYLIAILILTPFPIEKNVNWISRNPLYVGAKDISLSLNPPLSHEQRRFHSLSDVRRECPRVSGPTGLLHGDGPATGPLLHQLLTQYLPLGQTVRREVFRRDVQTSAAGRLQMRGAGLLGRQRRRRGTHHHPREGHVHRYPLQGCHIRHQRLRIRHFGISHHPLFREPLLLNEPGKTLPSPNDLKRKILIKNKRLKPEVEKRELELFLRGQLGNEEDEEQGETTNGTDATGAQTPAEGFYRFFSTHSIFKEVSEEQMAMANYQYTGATTHVHPYLSNMINYAEPVKFQGFDVAEEKNIHHNMSSFAETAALGYLKSQAIEFVNYNKRQMSRIYPKGTRADSSNYMPQIFWNAGCQMVALNFQTSDLPMQLNQGKFEYNGGCGYLLKPDFMRRPDRTFDPFAESPVDGVIAAQCSVRVISGQFLSDKKVGTYVEVDMYGLPTDTIRKEFRTRMVPANGLNPVYNEEPFVFRKVVLPDLAVLRIAVFDENGKMLGQRILPLDGLQAGYRHVSLRTEGNFPLSLAMLFICVELKIYIPDGLGDLMDALSDPRAFLSAQEKRVAQMKAMGIEEADVQTNDLKLGSVKTANKAGDDKKGFFFISPLGFNY
ncbi:1-phosphatidylinositol 4,5-bisphosphate phosphodiesterase beta-4 [Trichonephila clavata]|uniref:Phosphoinositide phospholipase C n=1 Tax=Trichonephila clavata TaxID=2740835 RepID=A0A8X6GUH3_TRICU|nr:1-phosphatidylinositol 4,5-bisphosphate phosphodiesterase beta-4 [Trichonephila clavata]